MTVLGPFDWNGLVKADRFMAQLLCGTYFSLVCVVCMNLYIALLSDTFARVYAQAKANAVMQQAKSVITLEAQLGRFKRSKYGHYMQRECSPQVRRNYKGNRMLICYIYCILVAQWFLVYQIYLLTYIAFLEIFVLSTLNNLHAIKKPNNKQNY